MDDPLGNAPDLIRAIGEALYGTQWTTDLSHGLGVNRRTVERWATGKIEPPDGIWPRLEHLLQDHAEAQWRLRRAVQERGYRMQHAFVPSPDCAEEGETPAGNEEELRKMCPWATEVIEVGAGWHVFESPADAAAWRERN